MKSRTGVSPLCALKTIAFDFVFTAPAVVFIDVVLVG